MPRTLKPRSLNLPIDFDSLVRAYAPQAIHDEAGYSNAMEYIDALTSLSKLSRGQSEYVETLAILVEAYEDENEDWSERKNLGPIAILKVLLEENEMNASDLGRLLGERSLGSKILTGSRELSKSNIRTVANHFGVSADLFL